MIVGLKAGCRKGPPSIKGGNVVIMVSAERTGLLHECLIWFTRRSLQNIKKVETG